MCAFRVDEPENRRVAICFNDITERKRAEEKTQELIAAVQQERDRLSALVNSITDEVWFADIKKQFTLANPSALQEFGIGTSDGAIDVEKFAASLEVYRPDGIPRPVEEAPPLRALQGEVVRNQEEIIRTPSRGELRYRQVNSSPVRDTMGNIIGSVSVVRDITDRKKAEETLRESEERLSSIYNTTGDVIFLLDVEQDGEYRFNTVNPSFLSTTGLPTEFVVGKSVKEVIPEPSLSLVLSKYRQAIQEKTIVRWEETSDYPTGRLSALVTIAPILDADGICQHLVGNVRDITDRKRAEQALQESETRYRNLVKYAPAGIYEVDFATARFTEVNDAMCQILGYSRDEILTMTPFDILDQEGRAHFASRISSAQSGGQPEEVVEYRVRTKDGRLIWALLIVTFHWNDGRIVKATVVSYDITERKQIEEELRKSKDELEVRVQERTADLAQSKKQLQILASQIVSAQENERKRIALEVHDVLGSSLSAIKFKVEEALLHLPKDGTSNISKPLEALIPLIQDTIEEARRIQADLRPPLLDDLGIVATFSWFCRRFETIYSGIKVEQTVTIREEEVPDNLKIALFRIAQEAMNNIGKYARADLVHLGLRKVDSSIELFIRDNGEGFDLESMFSRESSKKGLGLSSMKERVEFSGGSFSIESAKGKGTVIRAVWPV